MRIVRAYCQPVLGASVQHRMRYAIDGQDEGVSIIVRESYVETLKDVVPWFVIAVVTNFDQKMIRYIGII